MLSSTEHPRVISCKAAVAWGAGEALVMEEVEVSPPHPMEIRIKVVCTSLCRSDVTAWQSQAHASIFPRIFGHEASGIVESVGQGVSEFEQGDHVLTLFTGECMSCRHCTSGKSNICQVLGLERRGVMHSDQGTRFSVKGRPIYHYCAVSSFSEYTVVHSGCAVKVSSVAPLEKICLLSCGVAAGTMSSRGAGSSRQQRNPKVWLLPPFTYDYKSEKYSSPKDYYAGIRAEWAFRVTEQEGLFNDLRNFGAPVPRRRSLTMARQNVSDYEKAVSRIKKENNRMLMRRCRHFMLQLATEMAEASNRDLKVIERNNVLNNEKYLSDYYMSDEE